MQTSAKSFAPFGAELHKLRTTNKYFDSCPYLFVGKNAIEEAKSFFESGFISLCLPMGKSIGDYMWPVHDLKIILYDTGSMANLGIKRIAYDLLKLGASVVVLFNPRDQSVEIQKFKRI